MNYIQAVYKAFAGQVPNINPSPNLVIDHSPIEHIGLIGWDLNLDFEHRPIITEAEIPPSSLHPYLCNRLYFALLRKYFPLLYVNLIQKLDEIRLNSDLILLDIYTNALGWIDESHSFLSLPNDYIKIHDIIFLIHRINNNYIFKFDIILSTLTVHSTELSNASYFFMDNMQPLWIKKKKNSNSSRVRQWELPNIDSLNFKLILVTRDLFSPLNYLAICIVGKLENRPVGISISVPPSKLDEFLLGFNADIYKHTPSFGELVFDRFEKLTLRTSNKSLIFKGRVGWLNENVIYTGTEIGSVDIHFCDILQLPSYVSLEYWKFNVMPKTIVVLYESKVFIALYSDFSFLDKLLQYRGFFIKSNAIYKNSIVLKIESIDPPTSFKKITNETILPLTLNTHSRGSGTAIKVGSSLYI